MNALRRVLLFLKMRGEESSVFYVKSRDIKQKCGDLTTREVGARLSHIKRDGDIPISIETWSKTSGSRTYRVEVDDVESLVDYVEVGVEDREVLLPAGGR